MKVQEEEQIQIKKRKMKEEGRELLKEENGGYKYKGRRK